MLVGSSGFRWRQDQTMTTESIPRDEEGSHTAVNKCRNQVRYCRRGVEFLNLPIVAVYFDRGGMLKERGGNIGRKRWERRVWEEKDFCLGGRRAVREYCLLLAWCCFSVTHRSVAFDTRAEQTKSIR